MSYFELTNRFVYLVGRDYAESSPRMIWRWNIGLSWSWRFLFFGPWWSGVYLFVLQLPAVVDDVYAAIQPLLHHNSLHAHTRRRFFDLIQPSVISNGKIISHHPLFPHREDAIKIGSPGDLAVKISPLLWRDAESAVIPGQIAVQKPIGLPLGADPG